MPLSLQRSGLTFFFASAAAMSLIACDGSREIHGIGRDVRVVVNLPSGEACTAPPFCYYREPLPYASLSVSANIFRGEGIFEIYPGLGSNNGAFIIPRVPEEPYYLRIEDARQYRQLILTNTEDIDLSSVELGRGSVIVPTATTTARFEVSNLEPWEEEDDLQLFAANIGLTIHALEDFAATGTIAPGADDVSGLVLDFRARRLPLIEMIEGDHVTLLQLATRTAEGGAQYRAVSRVFDTLAPSLTAGSTVTVSGSFTELAPSTSAAIEWRTESFEAHRASVNPAATADEARFSINTLPSSSTLGNYSDSPYLVLQSTRPPAAVSATMMYANPFPAPFEPFAHYEFTARMNYSVNGASPITATARMAHDMTLEELSANPRLEVKLSPVLNPKIDGLDARGDVSGVGGVPLLSWDPPAVGTASLYHITLFNLSAADGRTLATRSADLYTSETSIALVLEAGVPYFARITALDSPTSDVQRAPFRRQLPSSSADVLTSTFTP